MALLLRRLPEGEDESVAGAYHQLTLVVHPVTGAIDDLGAPTYQFLAQRVDACYAHIHIVSRKRPLARYRSIGTIEEYFDVVPPHSRERWR